MLASRILSSNSVTSMQFVFYRTTLTSSSAAAAARWSSTFKVSNCLLKMTNNRHMTNSTPHGNPHKSHNKLDHVPEHKRTTSQSSTLNLNSNDEFPSLSAAASTLPVKGKRRLRIDLGVVSEKNSTKDVVDKVLNVVDALPSQPSAPKNHENLSPYMHGQPQHEHGETKEGSSFYPLGTNSNKSLSLIKSLQPHHEHGNAERSPAFSPPGTNNMKPSSYSKHWPQPSHERGVAKRSLQFSSSRTNKNRPISLSKRWKPPHEHGNTSLSSSHLRTSVDECFDICLPDMQKYNAPRQATHSKKKKIWVQITDLAEEDRLPLQSMEVKTDSEHSREENWKILRPGMILLKSYLPLKEQVEIVRQCRELGRGPGGFYRPGYKDGAKLRLYMMCLGLDWNPQTRKYGKKRELDNAVPPHIPQEFTSLVDRLLDECYALINRDLNTEKADDVLPRMSPDVCIVNFYNTNGRLGLHQDRDESRRSLTKNLPVVSLSIGDSAEFLYGDDRDAGRAESVVLESGDVLVFGGESRHIFHGVTTIHPKTAPRPLLEETKLRPGRLNLTFREY